MSQKKKDVVVDLQKKGLCRNAKISKYHQISILCSVTTLVFCGVREAKTIFGRYMYSKHIRVLAFRNPEVKVAL